MDSNSDINYHNIHVSKFISTFRLNDKFKTFPPHISKTTTYIRGTTRIDMILTSQNLQKYISGSDIIPVDQISQSDHHGIIMYISYKALKCRYLPQHVKIIPRKLHSTNTLSSHTYNNILTHICNKHIIQEKSNIYTKIPC